MKTSNLQEAPDWRYWFDFVCFPAAAAVLIAVDCRSLSWLGLMVAGFVAWTFVEYWVHRTVLHRVMWHNTHEQHHRRPSEFVVFPVWYLPLGFTALWLVTPNSLFAGFILGYVWFLSMHHMLHHWALLERTWLHRYAIWHKRHHKFTDCNYGITTSIWDAVFLTSR